ncbi:hypothetical protein Lal_00023536 [Lupinus albus]|nr:hypothetical protein Lal_00023536 [Lupinus albus]
MSSAESPAVAPGFSATRPLEESPPRLLRVVSSGVDYELGKVRLIDDESTLIAYPLLTLINSRSSTSDRDRFSARSEKKDAIRVRNFMNKRSSTSDRNRFLARSNRDTTKEKYKSKTTLVYKSHERNILEKEGYRIVGNIGD